MTKIVQISDPHIVPEGQLAYGQVDTAQALVSCVETINRLLPDIGPVDLAVVTGDLTDFGTDEEYQRFRSIMEPLAIPYRVIPGNHDDIDAMRRNFPDHDWMCGDGPINWLAKLDDFSIIGLDSSIVGKAHGHLTVAKLEFLHAALARLRGEAVFVALHHPPVLTGIEKMDIQNLSDSKRMQSVLTGHDGDVRLICGPIHRNIVTSFGNVICQIAPGTSHAVTMDQRVGAPNRLTKEPGAFLLHEMRAGLMSHNISIGDFDGPYWFYPE